jgi:hypothetical protein
MLVCCAAEGEIVVSDIEAFVMIVTLDGEGNARNIWERQKRV